MKKILSSILVLSSVVGAAVSTGCFAKGTCNSYQQNDNLSEAKAQNFIISLSDDEKKLLAQELNKAEERSKRQEEQKQSEIQEDKEMRELEKEQKRAEIEVTKANVGLVKSKANVNNSVSRSVDTNTNILIGGHITRAVLLGALLLISGVAWVYGIFHS